MASAKGARLAAMWGANQLEGAKQQSLGELATGYNASSDLLKQVQPLYQGMTQTGQQGVDQYGRLVGLGGADMSAELAKTPGYQFALNSGLDALNRRRAAGGMLNSGNADADAMALGQGLASQTLTQERQALSPYFGLYGQGTGGEAGALGTLAGLTGDYYKSRAGIINQTAQDQTGLGIGALKAGDAAKQANQATAMQGLQLGAQLLGTLVGGPMGGAAGGGIGRLFGGMGGGMGGSY